MPFAFFMFSKKNHPRLSNCTNTISIAGIAAGLGKVSAEHGLMGLLGENGFALLGVGFFLLLSYILYKIGIAKAE